MHGLVVQDEISSVFCMSGLNSFMMKDSRRTFLKLTGMMGMGMVSNALLPAAPSDAPGATSPIKIHYTTNDMKNDELSLIGPYGKWASGLHKGELPTHSFRRSEWTDLDRWKKMAADRLKDR